MDMEDDSSQHGPRATEPRTKPSVLEAEAIVSGYGKKRVLDDVYLNVYQGERVAIIGHNGAGKSTLLKTLFGMLPAWEGRILLDGRLVWRPNPLDWLKDRVVFIPQGNRVFCRLSVLENLQVAAEAVADPNRSRNGIEEVLGQCPLLSGKLRQLAGTLSGGEKQILALGMGLVTDPRVLLVDEPSLGLSPVLAAQMLAQLTELNRRKSTTIVVVEQKVRAVLKNSDRVYVLRNGKVSFSGRSTELSDEGKLRSVFL